MTNAELDEMSEVPFEAGPLVGARIVSCIPEANQRNTKNGLSGFKLVLEYQEKADG